MHLYQGTTRQFIADATQARLANILSDRWFDEFRYRPAPSEVTSWRNSLSAMAHVLQTADLTDQGILVELKMPLSSKRLDVLITGSNPGTRRDQAVIVELKQWTEVGRSNITDCVTVEYGGRPRDALHPSRQVAQYQRYLLDTHPAFSDDRAIALDACAYLHFAQHDPSSPLYHADFTELLGSNPAFAGDQSDALATFLDQRVAGPDEGEILDRVASTAFKPHKRLLDHVARRRPVGANVPRLERSGPVCVPRFTNSTTAQSSCTITYDSSTIVRQLGLMNDDSVARGQT